MKQYGERACDTSEYRHGHYLVRRRRGPARNYNCFFCMKKQASDWAKIHGTTGFYIIHYVPSCRKCHFTYDSPNKGNKYSVGRKFSEESKLKMSMSGKMAAPRRKRDQDGRFVA